MGVRNSTTTKADSEPNGSVSVSSFLNCEQIDTVQAQNGSPPQQSPSDTKYQELKTPHELSKRLVVSVDKVFWSTSRQDVIA